VITITEDHVAEGDEKNCVDLEITEMPLYGIERAMGESGEIPDGIPTTRFRLYDDDGNHLYSGVLTDDEDCLNQSAALRWGESMAGATVIKVFRAGQLVQEIA
jgi:hypothetical protein